MRRRGRRGDSLVDWLLVASLVAVGVVVAAYVYLPDFERSLGGAVRDLSARLGISL